MHFGKKKTKKREAFYKAQESEKTAETKERQFRNHIQLDVKINGEGLANTGEQKKQEKFKKVDKDDLTQ